MKKTLTAAAALIVAASATFAGTAPTAYEPAVQNEDAYAVAPAGKPLLPLLLIGGGALLVIGALASSDDDDDNSSSTTTGN